ncbi:hypothetical protein [Paracoccus sp. (in: a-proteobacteria)]|uniref:hypothetical protein n=1 Tax=Paracoccus sp. TaxID=267 RepID=UPI00289D6DE9|nr:hypothetical protein [Paracoccus sp. (in: a-proteobacteria)]
MAERINDGEHFEIEAVVRMNGGEAYVLNRAPSVKYIQEGNCLVGRDGPFVSLYQHDTPHGRFKAFAGAVFDIPLRDGGSIRASGQWWHSHPAGAIDAAWATNAGLLKCYVFSVGAWDPEALAAMRSAYKGEVYPYWAYQALIEAPRLRVASSNAKIHARKVKGHILRNLREIMAERDELRSMLAARNGEVA